MDKSIMITIKKELRSIFRDKKAVTTIFLVPLIIPFFIFFMGYIYDNMDSDARMYDIGIDFNISQSEQELLDKYNIKYHNYENITSMEQAYDKGDIIAYINYEHNKYKIYTDSSTNGMVVKELLESYFKDYSTYLTKQYLIAHDVNIDEAYNTFSVENIEMNQSSNFLMNLILNFSFTYIIYAICMATSSMSTSTTASERENGTLETLLTFPIKKTNLILGKYFSSVIVGCLASLFGLTITLISILIAKKTFVTYGSLIIDLSALNVLISVITIILASFFIGGVALALTAFSKSYKEAQSSAQLLSICAVIPMFISMMDVSITSYSYFIPIFNYVQILMQLFAGNLSILNLLLMLISTIIYIILIITYIIKAYNSEKVLFTT